LKVYLGGTWNKSTWRDRIIPILHVDYFNPIVDDWNEAWMAREIEERQICDLCLYVITPKMTGVYSIAEVVDDSNKRPDRTLLVVLRVDEQQQFTEGQWKSLCSVMRMVERNGGKVFDSLETVADYINSCYLERKDK